MVLQKRLDYGSSGYQVPVIPRVPRSARGKRSARKKVADKQMCAFDLLATVAGELLSERENSSPPCNPTIVKNTIKQEQLESEKPYKAEVFDQGSCNESAIGPETHVQRHKDNFSGEAIIGGTRGELGYSLGTVPKKCGSKGCSPGSVGSCECKVEVGIKTPPQNEWRLTGNSIDRNATNMYGLEDPMDLDAKPPRLVSSDSSVEVPRIACNGSFPKCGDGMGLAVYRDDDENSSGCTHPCIKTAKAFRPQRIGHRRIRKLLASKFWKVDPSALKEADLSNTDVDMKPVFQSRKMCYTRQRSQRSSFKRRKLFEHCSISASDVGVYNKGVSDSPIKGGIKTEAGDSQGANGASSSSTGQKSSYESRDFHVKLSIKAFKVPELFIEIPETATVGSLKRTVLEAVTAILEGGLRVGVHHQGKKVRDDSKTLLQAGISHTKTDNLGFTLEPNPKQVAAPLTTSEHPHVLLPRDATEPLNRNPAATLTFEQGAPEATPHPTQTSTLSCPESDHDSVHSLTDTSSVDRRANSKALVPIPAVSVEALAVVPLRKSRRSELVQRRIRRPFSVSEVEALVQAVEKLGTGRWRDVKLRAFDNAKHRTYVDLKDKWKTLVHTARISPQQRRGEPVPQELLDRVLAAHAYWSQQQAKLQMKPPPAESSLLL